MEIRTARSTSRDDLLGCRRPCWGWIVEIESRGGEMVETVKQRCASCDFREVCELDLRRDPNHPIWETYLPTQRHYIALTSPWWLTH